MNDVPKEINVFDGEAQHLALTQTDASGERGTNAVALG